MLFWNSLDFSMMLAIWPLVPLTFLNSVWTSGSCQFMYCWSLAWRILSIILLACEMSATVQKFEHSLALPFFGIQMKIDLFQSCGHCWVFQICWHLWQSAWRTTDGGSWHYKGGSDQDHHQPQLDAWDKCSDLVYWKEPEGSGREGGGKGIGMGYTCKSMATSCQCMTKTTTIL